MRLRRYRDYEGFWNGDYGPGGSERERRRKRRRKRERRERGRALFGQAALSIYHM